MKLNTLVILLFSCISVFGQQIDLSKEFKNWKPRAIGPASMSGRITAIDALHENPSFIVLGSASGGVWKTTNGGSSWEPIFDEQPTLNIGSIAIQQDNPSVIWAGTGEGNPRNSINLGEGIFKTIDGGKSWSRMGLEKTSNIHRVIIDPREPKTVYAGVIGNPYAAHPERGVFKTEDGGQSWKKILYTNDSSGIGDMIMDPSNPKKLFAAMWHHHRTPYSLQSGGKGSGLYVTFDGGNKWKKLGKEEGLPDGDYGRIGLSISNSNPDYVYALIESKKNGLYRSTDGGFHWELVNSDAQWVTNRPFYFQDIAVDPQNENRLWLIYQMIAASEDGGKTFKVVIPYNGIHPDHHAFWINPKNPNFIIDGNDGGIGISRDKGKTWQFDEKIPVGQFYHINVDDEIPYNVMGGMQDNGSWRGPAYTWTRDGLRNFYWENLWGGDGFDVMPDAEDANWIYAMSQGGNVGRLHVPTGDRWFIKPPTLDTNDRLRFNWNAAMAQDPFDKKSIYFGSQYLHKTTDKGASWITMSPDLTTNDSIKMDQSNNGGLSVDITGAENYCTILTIAPSSKDRQVIWVGTDDGNVQLTRDGGKTWTNFRKKIPGMPTGAWVPQIIASRHSASEAFVVANDYRRGDLKPYIFRTKDFGKTWTRLADEKKVKGYALCVLQDPVQPNLIFAGTENGLWVSLDNGESFQQWKNGYPSVSTFDLAIQEREADLVIASFGRSIYVLDNIRPLRQLAATKGVFTKKLEVFDTPDAYLASFKSAPGYDYSNWGLWEAPNRPGGALVSFYFDKDKSDTSKADTVLVKIYDHKNEVIRTLKWKADTGFNRHAWTLEEKGFRTIGSPKPAANAVEPAGWQVLPGRYRLVLSYKDLQDSTWITVKEDPRIESTIHITTAQRKLQKELQEKATKLVEGMDRLSDAETVTKKIQEQLKGIEGKSADTIQKAAKTILESIKITREYIVGKRQSRQGYGMVPQVTVANQVSGAISSLSSKKVMPGEQEMKLVSNAEKMLEEGIQRVNKFFETDWKQFRKLNEENPVKLFKDYTPL